MSAKKKEFDRNTAVVVDYEFPPKFDRILWLLVGERKADTVKGQSNPSAKMRSERPTLWIDRGTGSELRFSALNLFRDWIPGCTLDGARIKKYIERMSMWRSHRSLGMGKEYPMLRDTPQLIAYFFSVATYNPAWFTEDNAKYTERIPFSPNDWLDCKGKTLVDPRDPLRRDIAIAFTPEPLKNGSILTTEDKLKLHMLCEFPSIEQNYPDFFARSQISAEMRALLDRIPDNPAIGLLQSKLAVYVAQTGSIEEAIDDIISVTINDWEDQGEDECSLRSKLEKVFEGIIKKGTIPRDVFPNGYWAIACVLKNDYGEFYGGDIESLFEDCGIVSDRKSEGNF